MKVFPFILLLWMASSVVALSNPVNLPTQGVTLMGPTGEDTGVAAATGDFDGSGSNGLALGAPRDADNVGAVYVVFSTNVTVPTVAGTSVSLDSLDGVNGTKVVGAAANDTVGVALKGAGDVSLDGVDDLVIGQPGGAGSAGTVWILFGRNSTTAWPAVTTLAMLPGAEAVAVTGEGAGDNIGQAVGGGRDFNNDGRPDVLMGSATANASQGVAYCVFQPVSWVSPLSLATVNGANGFRMAGAGAGDQLGWSIDALGDVNNDGLQDFAVGAPGANGAGGYLYVVFGRNGSFPATLDMTSLRGDSTGFRLDGGVANQGLGASVVALGDLDRDGFDDFVVTGYGLDTGGPNARAFVVFGRDTWADTAVVTAMANVTTIEAAATTFFGWSSSRAGDVDGDGNEDLLIGAPNGDGFAAIVYGFGSEAWPALINVTAVNATLSTTLLAGGGEVGTSVAALGDVDADGFDDVLVGARANSVGYVVYGSQATESPTAVPSAAPTTAAPTTAAPATATPTTAAPSTAAPTTGAPATPSPSTGAPTTGTPTQAPNTPAPTTVAPVTPSPSTASPTTAAPSTAAPTTATPTTVTPTATPTTAGPTTTPVTSSPITASPATGGPTPSGGTPTPTNPPVTNVPSTLAPTTSTNTPTASPSAGGGGSSSNTAVIAGAAAGGVVVAAGITVAIVYFVRKRKDAPFSIPGTW